MYELVLYYMTNDKNNLIDAATNFVNNNKASKFLDPDYAFEIIAEKHTKHILEWRNRPNVIKWMILQDEFTKALQSEFLKNYRVLDRIDFVLVNKQTREPYGSFHLTRLPSNRSDGLCGYEIGKLVGDEKQRKKGIAYNATRALLSFVFEELKLDVVYARTKFDNKVNYRLNKKLGFTSIGKEDVGNGRIFIIMELKNNLR